MRFVPAVLGLALAGCGKDNGSGSDVEGIWAIWLPASAGEDGCAPSVTHNFLLGYVPAADGGDTGDTGWIESETGDTSGSLFFVQVESLGDGRATMLAGAEAYPGVEEGGSWIFSWTGSDTAAASRSHASGYAYSESLSSTSGVTVTFNPDSGAATGTWDTEAVAVSAWTESDLWDETAAATVGENGEMPSTDYLVYDDTATGTPTALSNTRTGADCVAAVCELTVTSTCSESLTFEATRTGYQDESAYEHVQNAGQPPGA